MKNHIKQMHSPDFLTRETDKKSRSFIVRLIFELPEFIIAEFPPIRNWLFMKSTKKLEEINESIITSGGYLKLRYRRMISLLNRFLIWIHKHSK